MHSVKGVKPSKESSESSIVTQLYISTRSLVESCFGFISLYRKKSTKEQADILEEN